MKRKKNFLLFVWAAAIFGLFAVQAVHAAGKGFHIPAELAVYETETESVQNITNDSLVALLSAETFNDTVKNYALTSAYKARTLVLGFNWEPLSGTEKMDSTAAPVKVLFSGKEVSKYVDSNQDRKFGTHYTDVYVIPFEAGANNVSGQVEVDLTSLNKGKLTYTATVTRGTVDNITTLRAIWVTDSVTTNKTDTIFDKKAGEDGKLKPENDWNISFKEYKDVKGRAKSDTLYFQKFDGLSTVHVIKNATDTLNAQGKAHSDGKGFEETYTHIGSEIYKVKIEAGNQYTIAVTARDNQTKGYYYVTLLDDTVKTLSEENDSLKHMLKDIYLYKKDGDDTVRYELRASASGKVGFNWDTLSYKVTAPDAAEVNYTAWDKDSINLREVIVLNYTKSTGERFFEVRVDSIGDDNKSARYDRTYKIQVHSGDNFLKDLHLSYDKAGEKPLELTSSLSDTVFKYTSVDVELDTKSVFVWATTRDDRAKVQDQDFGFDTVNGKFFKELTLTKDPGLEETFSVPVWAEDSTLIRNYNVSVRRKWNPNLNFVTFFWSGGRQYFLEDDLAKSDGLFDVKVPASVDFEDINVSHEDKDKSHYRVTKTLKSVGDAYSYVIKVVTVDRKEESKADKTYTFNLFHKSNDAHLSRLSVTPGGKLSPDFGPDIFEYSVRVPHAQDHIYFVAQTRDELASANVGGKHNLEVGEQTFLIVVTAENGEKTETYRITVTRESATGIQPVGVSAIQVSVSGQSLHVNTPAAEQVSVYSAGGKLLYSLDKPAGKTSVAGLPKGILIVKGSSGWVEKVAIR